MSALLRFIAALVLLLATSAGAADNPGSIVVIAHAGVDGVDVATVQRLYTGRAIQVGGVAVTVVNLAPGNPLRERFLSRVLDADAERYDAYWTVRRHVGKGVPPREFRSAAEVIDFVVSTPGAMGYIGATDLRPGLNIVLRP